MKWLNVNDFGLEMHLICTLLNLVYCTSNHCDCRSRNGIKSYQVQNNKVTNGFDGKGVPHLIVRFLLISMI